ncbi:hypothetical protein TKK_0016289 [Trichogramma kaykai]
MFVKLLIVCLLLVAVSSRDIRRVRQTDELTTQPPITCAARDHQRCREVICKDPKAYCFYGHFKAAKLLNPCSCEVFSYVYTPEIR